LAAAGEASAPDGDSDGEAAADALEVDATSDKVAAVELISGFGSGGRGTLVAFVETVGRAVGPGSTLAGVAIELSGVANESPSA
jgi:hypothetical protein